MATPINVNLSEDVNNFADALGSAPGDIAKLSETLQALTEAIVLLKGLHIKPNENINNFTDAVQIVLGHHYNLVDSYVVKDFVRIALGNGIVLADSLQAINDAIVAQTFAILNQALSDSYTISDNIELFLKQLLIVAENINNYDENLQILLTKRKNLEESLGVMTDAISTNKVFDRILSISETMNNFTDGIQVSLKLHGYCA